MSRTLFLFVVVCSTIIAQDFNKEDYQSFFSNFDANQREQFINIANQFEIQPRVIELMQKPAEKLDWQTYRKRLLTEKRIQDGKKFMQEHKEILSQIKNKHGIPPSVLTALVGVETSYGKITGTWKVGDALKTLAFAYPARASFFKNEFKIFLELVASQKLPADLKGSYAGAFGLSQFMPSSYCSYAKPFNEGTIVDMMRVEDALTSAAHYLLKHGWQTNRKIARQVTSPSVETLPVQSKGSPKPNLDRTYLSLVAEHDFALLDLNQQEHWIGYQNFYVLTRYNHSTMYAMVILQLAQSLQETECEYLGCSLL